MTSYYPPKTGAKVNLDTALLLAIAVGVWVLVFVGANAI